MSRPPSPLVELTAGAFAGALSIAVAFPFDTMKVIMQTAATATTTTVEANAKANHGPLDVIRGAESWRSFYRGMMSPVVGAVAVNAIMFCSYSNLKEAQLLRHEYANIVLAGGLTGAALSLVECPIELVKLRCQAPKEQRGVVGMTKEVVMKSGWRGLFRGWVPTFLRNVPANAVYFTVYEGMRKELGCNVLISGGVAGMLYWVACYPLDVIKSVVQMRAEQGTWQCTKEICNFGGSTDHQSGKTLKPLFRGFVPCIARAFIAGAVCFVTYEIVKDWMVDDHHENTSAKAESLNAASG